MAKKTKTYDPKKKQEALELADKVGVTEASNKTGIKVQTLYDWRRGVSKSKTGTATVAAKATKSAPTKSAPAARANSAVAAARSLLESKAAELRAELKVIEKMLAASH